MKSLKLFAVVALFGTLLTACEVESLTEDQNMIEEIEIISSTGNDSSEVATDEEDGEDGN